jgi:hypothetical protein
MDYRTVLQQEVGRVPERPSPYRHGQQWGRWTLDTQRLALTHTELYYPIDLGGCTSSARVLDWIFQIARKPWCTSEDIHYLLDAFDALLRPQAHLCSMGIDHTFDAARFLREQVARTKA